MLGKRAGELDKLFQELHGDTESESFPIPEESATLPSTSSQRSGPVDGSMTFGNPLPSISKEPLPVSSPDRAPPDHWHGMMKMWLDIFGHPEGHSFINLDEPSATPPSSSPQPSGPDYRSMAVKDPLPSVSKGASQVSSSDRAPTDDGLIGHSENLSSPKRFKLSATSPSSGLQPSGVDGSMAIEKPVPSISKEPSLVSSSDGAPTDDGLMKMWLSIIGQPEDLSSSKRVKEVKKPVLSISKEPSLVSSSGGAPTDDGLMKMWLRIIGQPENLSSSKRVKKVKKPVPSISKEPSLVSNSGSAPLSADNGMKKWRDLMNHHKSLSSINLEKLKAAHLSSISQPPGPASISKEPLPVSSPDYTDYYAELNKMWFNLVGQSESHFFEKPAESSASGPLPSSPSQMDVRPSSPVSSTNSDSQRMGAGSSSGKRKRP